jgi:hypothetical protein
VATFWRYLPQDGPQPGPADLGRLLRQLHQLDPPPVPLRARQPLVSVRRAIDASRAISEGERTWLQERCQHLLAAYAKLSFPLPEGLIHGDAWRGTCSATGTRVVLAD